jgi:hypothetical protein
MPVRACRISDALENKAAAPWEINYHQKRRQWPNERLGFARMN